MASHCSTISESMGASDCGRGVRGVVLDAALFHNNSDSADGHLEKLVHRLFYSHIRVGILFRNSKAGSINDFKLVQEKIEKLMPSKTSIDIKNSSDDCYEKALKEFSGVWELSGSQCIFLTFSLKESLKDELSNQGWHICLPIENSNSCVNKRVNHIQEVYNRIARINKGTDKDVTVVGYSMKWNREMDFLKRGALPLNRIHKNLSFLPVNLELPLSEQLKVVDVMLHKPTDEITSAAFGEIGILLDQINFTDAMQRSIKFLSSHHRICVVDPIERVLPLVDRALTLEILQGLSNMEHPESRRIRAPRYKRVLKFDNVDPSEILEDCNFSLPAIVKPQVACGVSDAHIMAVVFKDEGFLNLAVPVPSTMQEYIDHGSILYKFYVIGEKMFYSVRNSTPNAAKSMELSSSSNLPAVIIFDSLKSLPKHFTTDEDSMSGASVPSHEIEGVDLQLVSEAATWLREKLKLTIFGFDVVIELATGDHVIIDMNFFPTFKDIDDQKAIPAFWDALLRSHSLHKEAGAASLPP